MSALGAAGETLVFVYLCPFPGMVLDCLLPFRLQWLVSYLSYYDGLSPPFLIITAYSCLVKPAFLLQLHLYNPLTIL